MSISNARFIGIGRHKPRIPWRMKAHAHSFHEIIVILEGGQSVLTGGSEIRAAEGDILFYKKGVPHEEWTGENQRLVSCFASCEWGDCPPDLPVLLKDRRGRVRMLTEWLYEEAQSHTALTPDLTGSLFHAVLGQIVESWAERDEGFVGRIRGYVREHIGEELDLETLVRLAGMSKFHFVRKYGGLTGRTPMEDVRALRVEYARDLVLSTSLPLKLIAEKAGLGDQYHMSRLFRKHLGTSPGRLRRPAR